MVVKVHGVDHQHGKGAVNSTVTVGTGGDFSSINDAIDHFVGIYHGKNVTATINMLAGFVVAEEVVVDGVDLGWITIGGADVNTSITRSALTTSHGGSYAAFTAKNGGTLPVINQLFVMDATGTATSRMGILCIRGKVKINGSCGVNDAGESGLYLTEQSEAYADSAQFTGATVSGAVVYYGSRLYADNIILAHCDGTSIEVSYGSHAVIRNMSAIKGTGSSPIACNVSSGSVVDMTSADLSGARTGSNVLAVSSGSVVQASSVDCSGASPSNGCVVAQASLINFRNGDVSNTTGSAVFAYENGVINATSGTFTGTTANDAIVQTGGQVNVTSATGVTTLSPATPNNLTSSGIIFQ